MNEGMLAAAREIALRVRLTLATGSMLELDGAQALGFAVEEGADGALLPGNVLSARLTLTLANDEGQWRYGGSLRGERPLVGATAEVFVVNGGEELPCGAFIIDSVSARERSGAIVLSGSDSVASELAAEFRDRLVYPATLQQVWEELVSQTRYVWSGSVPNGSALIDSAPEWGSVTLRKAAGWIAQAAGCFVRVNRVGMLELAGCQDGAVQRLSPEHYLSLDDGFQEYGPVAAIQVTPMKAEESFTVSAGGGDTVSVSGNPLFVKDAPNVQNLAAGMLAQMKGLTLNRAAFVWRGDPAVGVGARIALTDTYGAQTLCTVTRQTLRFENGFSAECICSVPERTGGGIVRAITPEGGVNANALVGTVDGGLIAAESVTAKSIAAKAVTAEKIAAKSVGADHLAAGSVTADKLDAGTVSAKTAEFLAAEIGKLTASDVEADRLYAAFGHLISLAADSIAAGTVSADRLAAALARVVSLHAATGEFDFATVQNLVAGAMSLSQASADSVYIKNLAVTSANLLSATLGKLVLKGDDGKYYRVFVGSDGAILAEELSEEAGMGGDLPVVETNMNVGSLNASNVQASGAVINEILAGALSAGQITAADALIASATIPALYAVSIQAIGDTLDLSANESVRIAVGEARNELEVQIGEASAGAEAQISAVYSELVQRGDSLELAISKKQDAAELRTWMRYGDGTLELGRSDSRYTSQISDSGFVVRQDGDVMASMVQNTVSAPVFNAQRMYAIGEHAIRLGAAGHLIFN